MGWKKSDHSAAFNSICFIIAICQSRREWPLPKQFQLRQGAKCTCKSTGTASTPRKAIVLIWATIVCTCFIDNFGYAELLQG